MADRLGEPADRGDAAGGDPVIYAENGKEREYFITFVEDALGILAKQEYASFLALFDSSRLTEQDLVLVLRYLDETRPILKIDDPAQVENKRPEIYFGAFNDGSGYHMDYDLTTDGERNDLTVQVEFLKEKDGYIAVLDDLHTL